MAIKGARAKDRQISPHLIVGDVDSAVDFYRRAFGAIELYRSPLPGGSGLHAHLQIGNSMVMVTSEMPGDSPADDLDSLVKLRSPEALGGTTSLLEVFVGVRGDRHVRIPVRHGRAVCDRRGEDVLRRSSIRVDNGKCGLRARTAW